MATREEALALLTGLRGQLDQVIAAEADNPSVINRIPDGIRPWKMGSYVIGDVRVYEGNPYKCVQAHDSTGNEGWNPTVASLWMQYHGTSVETARNYVAPTGAHDIYKVGEYMIFTDGLIYHCIQNTAYDPVTYAQAWEAVAV